MAEAAGTTSGRAFPLVKLDGRHQSNRRSSVSCARGCYAAGDSREAQQGADFGVSIGRASRYDARRGSAAPAGTGRKWAGAHGESRPGAYLPAGTGRAFDRREVDRRSPFGMGTAARPVGQAARGLTYGLRSSASLLREDAWSAMVRAIVAQLDPAIEIH